MRSWDYAEAVTIGVFENNDIAHECYKKIGFKDKEVTEKEPFNIIEMELKREDFILQG
ncbi:hypothetical protein [Butyrivibrio sp. MC2021]|uniref:hypothetical protein n=1 Tax=Butyrivibrio sp. MC2021 TaxID=1408306 RepID=UPI000B30E0B8|nr:hypothetical protein [Butyrivibrio sp. MC2021]